MALRHIESRGSDCRRRVASERLKNVGRRHALRVDLAVLVLRLEEQVAVRYRENLGDVR
ncbi:hypothetical protein D3C87_1523550 [compost metagenome]